MSSQYLPIRANGVSVVVVRKRGDGSEALILKRAVGTNFPEAWAQVAGGLEAGETAWKCALRELREETGLVAETLHSAGICEQFYDATENCIHLVPLFVAFVNANEEVILNREHTEYKWLGFDEVRGYLATPNQCELFDHVRRHFVESSSSPRTAIEIRR